MPPPKSPPDDATEWKPFSSGYKDAFNPPDDDNPSPTPAGNRQIAPNILSPPRVKDGILILSIDDKV